MKKSYLNPELILIPVAPTDVITASGDDDIANDKFAGSFIFVK